MSGELGWRPALGYLKSQQALHRLLRALLCESYKPIRLLDLFDQVYSDEIFFPEFSSDKMHQLIKRLRKFLSENKIPIEIICKNEIYYVRVNANFTLTNGKKHYASREKLLHDKCPQKSFSVEEAQSLWGCSNRTTLRRLQELKKNDSIAVLGKTRSTRYKFIY